MRDQQSWVDMIRDEMAERGDSMESVEACVPPLDSDGMTRPFDNGYGCSEGCPFTLWTATRVYFPVTYDGAESVGSAPRNPCAEATRHVGGE